MKQRLPHGHVDMDERVISLDWLWVVDPWLFQTQLKMQQPWKFWTFQVC
jgi:hypothetical protein